MIYWLIRCRFKHPWKHAFRSKIRRENLVLLNLTAIGIVSFSTYRSYLSKEDEMAEWFCSLVMTSVAPDWNPALPRAGVFPLYFSSYYSKRVSKKSCWFGSISPFDLFLHLIIFILFCLVFYLRFKHHKSLPLQHCYSIHGQNYRD